jgi:hypothetical protein
MISRLFPFTMLFLLLLTACGRSAADQPAVTDDHTIVVYKSPT